MQQIRRCPKGDYVTDQDILYCPQCNSRLLKAGPDTHENKGKIRDEVQEEQLAKVK